MRRTFLITSSLLLAQMVIGCQTTPPPTVRDQRAQRLVGQAEVFLDRGLSDSALAAFGLALEENFDITVAHLGMGNIYRERGDYRLASRAYERAIDTDPNSFEAHYNLGLVRQLMGEIELAVRTYLRALTLDPDNAQANRDLASAYLQLNRPGEALPYARRATRLSPRDAGAWANLASALSLTGDYEQAINAYRQAADLTDEPAEPVLLGLADAHIRLGNHQLAINVLESLLRTHNSPTARERYGYALFKLRRFDEALVQFETALQQDSENVPALNGVGVCLMTKYLLDEGTDRELHRRAVEAWRRSLQLRPNQSHIQDLLARFGRG